MKKYIAGILTVFLCFTVFFPTNNNGVKAASKTMYVTADNLNVRGKSSTNSKIITVVKKNTKLIVTKHSGNWGYVKVNGKNGWVSTKYLTSKTPVKTKTMYVTANNLNVRGKSSTNAKIITSVKKNTKLIVTKHSGNWGYVKVNGKHGWVSTKYLTSKAPVTTKTMYTRDKTALKKNASTSSSTLKTINKEATITLYSTTSGKYAKAKYGKINGWVLKSKVKDSKTITTTSKTSIKYKTVKQNDNTLAKGTTKVVQKGINGSQTATYKKTYKNGKLISTKTLSSKVTKKTANQIVKVGTKTTAVTKAAEYKAEVVRLVNQKRTKENLAPLKILDSLAKVAEVKSKDMRDNNYFSHTSPTYGNPAEMVKKFNISFTVIGENIAAGYVTPKSVVDGWMNSPGHKANILDKRFTHIGIGYAEGGSRGVYWTQLFLKQ